MLAGAGELAGSWRSVTDVRVRNGRVMELLESIRERREMDGWCVKSRGETTHVDPFGSTEGTSGHRSGAWTAVEAEVNLVEHAYSRNRGRSATSRTCPDAKLVVARLEKTLPAGDLETVAAPRASASGAMVSV